MQQSGDNQVKLKLIPNVTHNTETSSEALTFKSNRLCFVQDKVARISPRYTRLPLAMLAIKDILLCQVLSLPTL